MIQGLVSDVAIGQTVSNPLAAAILCLEQYTYLSQLVGVLVLRLLLLEAS